MLGSARKPKRADADWRLADYATAFDFVGKLGGATTENHVIENTFDLFSSLFAPATMIYVSIAEGYPKKNHFAIDGSVRHGSFQISDASALIRP